MRNEDKNLIIQNYEALLERFGDDPQAVQWRDRATQEARFKALTGIDDLKEKKILDFGCGKADLFNYLEKKKIIVDYTGYDISPKMVSFAQGKNPNLQIYVKDIFKESISESFDYGLISGTFNNRISDNWGFIFKTIETLWPHLNKGIGFNLISTYVDYEEKGLFYADPKIIFDWLKKNITRYITLRNDYMPFEYTVYAYKDSRP